MEAAIPLSQITTVGIDPGQVNMGLAVLYGNRAEIYEATIPSSLDPIERIMLSAHAVQAVLARVASQVQAGCVEGAAHLAGPGQVPLGENRVAAAIALMQGGVWPVVITPPATIREKVFGHGRTRAQEIWPKMPENAVSAFGCALYAYHLLTSNKTP